ncbi:sensor domain-containing diguanylate cyclase [Paraburkholderia adhaesiva]|uniref:sensor domain-containing diguanylate cyclase n=1 Tax=Paraburkholderia adhaesiva TaxID=2883244 RepID=UPI001F266473|nr:GGDEF domain-containing protein [Paraburkholderia adhaesiva]
MPKRVLSLRHRAQHWLLARGRAATLWIGNWPVLGGLSGTLVATVMAGVTFAAIYSGYAEELDHAAENSRNIVRLLSSDIGRNVELYDLSLQAVVSGAQQPETWQLPPGMRQRVLFNRATAASSLGGAYVLDANGYVKAWQSGAHVPDVSFADRDYFLAQQQSPSVGLFLSKPFFSRLRGGVPTIGLTRRINAPDGSFAGVALLAVQLNYFQYLLDRIDVGPNGRAFILTQDGTMLASKPPGALVVGANYATSPSFAFVAKSRSGTHTGRSIVDGKSRMYSFAHVANAPLVVVVAPAIDDILARWRKRSAFAIAMTTLIGAAWVVVSWALAFALRGKVAAEGELMRLAMTDGLTGLANRRALDRRLAVEWQRAVREREPLSVLFFDIDHFKLFNDTYGHAAGDAVLELVAGRIASGARRATDMAARYGGEEFTLILPDTSLPAAVKIAEKIRKKVESADLEHSASSHGCVTISVGCASCDPPVGGSGANLLAAADRLLYDAKEAGRNQVRAQQWTGDEGEPPAPQGSGTGLPAGSQAGSQTGSQADSQAAT